MLLGDSKCVKSMNNFTTESEVCCDQNHINVSNIIRYRGFRVREEVWFKKYIIFTTVSDHVLRPVVL